MLSLLVYKEFFLSFVICFLQMSIEGEITNVFMNGKLNDFFPTSWKNSFC